MFLPRLTDYALQATPTPESLHYEALGLLRPTPETLHYEALGLLHCYISGRGLWESIIGTELHPLSFRAPPPPTVH